MEVLQLRINQLKPNEVVGVLYPIDDEFERLRLSIQKDGVLEPLVVHQVPESNIYEIISGVRRYNVALSLSIETLPCIIKPYREIDEFRCSAHQEYRTRTKSELLRDFSLLLKGSGVKQGRKSHQFDNSKLERLDTLKGQLGKCTSRKFRRILRLREELKFNEREVEKEDERLNKSSLDSYLKYLESKKTNLLNGKINKPNEVNIFKHGIVYNRDSSKLDEVRDNSIQCIITSPPYFKLKDYEIGDNQYGQEDSVDKYIDNLVNHFESCKRTLKDNGVLWVNIADSVQEMNCLGVPEKFLIGMLAKGWLLHDKLIWAKRNPHPTPQSRKSLTSHEYIYVFKLQRDVKYSFDWLKFNPENNVITEIKTTNQIFLRSFLDFRNDGIIISNSAENSALRKILEKHNIKLSHSATFPSIIPLIAILVSSDIEDSILDVFSGTGTVAEVANSLGRKFIGYELNPQYTAMSIIRINEGSGQFEVKAA